MKLNVTVIPGDLYQVPDVKPEIEAVGLEPVATHVPAVHVWLPVQLFPKVPQLEVVVQTDAPSVTPS